MTTSEATPRTLPRQRGFGETKRTDSWWLQPLAVFLGLSAFVVYSTWAAFQNADYRAGSLLSPMYAPELWGGEHAWLGKGPPSWWPSFLPYSPAFLILWIPAGFRFTCYYYRGTYYKAFWADPPACAVGEPRKHYRGEQLLPLVLQNIHRFFMYLAVAFIFLLAWDVWEALWWRGADGQQHFGISVGTLVLALNVVLLGGYTFGCHSLRHVVGGFLDVFSRHPSRFKIWKCVTCLNQRHMAWAWTSLIWVMFCDLYVRLCARGVWSDLRLIG